MTISNQKFTGRTFYLMVETSPGVYAQVGGLRANSISINNEEVDVTDKDDGTWKKLLAGGGRSLGASGSGFVTNNAAFLVAKNAADTGTPINAKVVYAAGKAYAAVFLITSCELNGEYKGAQQFSASLSSMNTPYIGIAGAVPTLDLNFAETGSLQPSIGSATAAFTRSTSKLYRDVDGLLKTAAINVQAFEHDSAGNRMGYIPEPASTNLLLPSADFSDSNWVKTAATVVADSAIAPDGTATADQIFEAATTGEHLVSQTVTATANAQYTYSCFLKRGTRDFAMLSLRGELAGTNGAFAFFNLLTGVVGTVSLAGTASAATSSIEPYRDGWYRCSITATIGGGDTTIVGTSQLATANGTGSYTGSTANYMFAWGAQFEVQPQVTSYIATTSAQVSRGADVLTYTSITGLSTTEGALVVEFYEPATSAGVVANAVSLNDGTTSERGNIYRGVSNGSNTGRVDDGGANQVLLAEAALANGALARIALGFKTNDFAASFQGATAQPDTSGTMFTPNQLHVGHDVGTSQPGRPIKRVTYYATKPANADIQALAA